MGLHCQHHQWWGKHSTKTLTEKEQPKEQQEEPQDSGEYVVLTLDEGSSPQIDSDIDPYGELEERPDDDANKHTEVPQPGLLPRRLPPPHSDASVRRLMLPPERSLFRTSGVFQ